MTTSTVARDVVTSLQHRRHHHHHRHHHAYTKVQQRVTKPLLVHFESFISTSLTILRKVNIVTDITTNEVNGLTELTLYSAEALIVPHRII